MFYLQGCKIISETISSNVINFLNVDIIQIARTFIKTPVLIHNPQAFIHNRLSLYKHNIYLQWEHPPPSTDTTTTTTAYSPVVTKSTFDTLIQAMIDHFKQQNEEQNIPFDKKYKTTSGTG